MTEPDAWVTGPVTGGLLATWTAGAVLRGGTTGADGTAGRTGGVAGRAASVGGGGGATDGVGAGL
ncbi:MAG: hypothetical protein VW582_07190, partial [Rhodospirillaceae bacterium]